MTMIRSALVVGFVFWAVATAIFLPFGHLVFGPDNTLPVAVSIVLSVVVTFAFAYAIARRILSRSSNVDAADGALVGAFMCLPGLLLDGLLYALGGGRYPGLDAAASGAMSVMLLFAYAAGLLAALNASLPLRGSTR